MIRGSSEDVSYFNLSHHSPHHNESHESISPLSSSLRTRLNIRRKLARPRLDEYSRSHSDGICLERKIGGEISNKGTLTHHSTPQRLLERNELVEKEEVTPRPTVSSGISASSSEQTRNCRLGRRGHLSQSTKSSSDASPQSRQRPEPRRYRTSPSWTKMLVKELALRNEQKVSLSSVNRRRMSDSIYVPRSSLQPLRPPLISKIPSFPVLGHSIKVEKPFNELSEQNPKPQLPVSSKRRASSTIPKQVISASAATLRKLIKSPNNTTTQLASDIGSQHKVNPPDAKDHKTNLKKQQTTAILTRVSSLLQDVKKLDLIGIGRFDRATAANKSRRSGVLRELGDDSPAFIGGVRSTEMKLVDVASQTSSIINLARGCTPNNTPEAQAKYIVINCEGKPEEFFKIDISIRGQTSYLPSEARRIHTPPLPLDSIHGKRKGFFFDYTTPPKDAAQSRIAEQIYSTIRASGEHINDFCAPWVHAPPSMKRLCPQLGKKGAKVRTGDWYATQLAEFDTVPVDIGDQLSAPKSPGGTALACWFDVEQKLMEDEKRLDFDIPEHLPSSPLCPRHPKYWRIVKQKGSQFRGC